MARLEEVYKTSGIPEITFVKPREYTRLIVSLRTPGRGIVIEGPSGIGKTSSMVKALDEIGLSETVIKTSARRRADIDVIKEFLDNKKQGILLIDDFHRLDPKVQFEIAELMKILADEDDATRKIIIVGINRAGDTLIRFSEDLNNRIDTIRFERNPDEKILELISLGENSLNINLNSKDKIIEYSIGSFHLAQILANEACVQAGVTESVLGNKKDINVSGDLIKERVVQDFDRLYFDKLRRFAAGPKLRQEGRAPYLHILKWLSESEDWSIYLKQSMSTNPEQKASLVQIVQQESINRFFSDNPDFLDMIYFNPETKFLSIDDPKVVFYLRNLLWNNFSKRVGFANINFESDYDVALSFAGSDRDLAELIYKNLSDREIAVFYDKNEQHRILAEVVEDYLGPIYRSESKYVIAIIGSDYPNRIWTKFESDQFRARFGENAVIPVWVKPQRATFFDETYSRGSAEIDREKSIDKQINEICDDIAKKIEEDRLKS